MAGRQARAGGTLTGPGLVACRRRPLSWNVRRHPRPPCKRSIRVAEQHVRDQD